MAVVQRGGSEVVEVGVAILCSELCRFVFERSRY